MDISKLTKGGFIDLVDQMLDIVYVGNADNYINNINKLIKLFCKNPLQITNISEIINDKSGQNYNIEKIIPCNTKESLLLKIIDENKKISFLRSNTNKGGRFSKIYKKYSNKLDGKIVKTTIENDSVETLLNRVYGKPKEKMDITTDGEKLNQPSIQIEIITTKDEDRH